MDWNLFFEPIVVSLRIAIPASLIVFAAAALAARAMARSRMRPLAKAIVDALLLLPLVLPPTVVGFILLVALGRRSWIGRLLEALTGGPVVFTWGAAVIAAAVVAFPLAYRTMRAGFEAVDRELEDAARSQGASEWQVFLRITMPLASRSLAAGYILGFARGLGEFGATLMVAGNIPGRTRTLPSAVYAAVDTGDYGLAWGWAAMIVVISLAMLYLSARFAPKP